MKTDNKVIQCCWLDFCFYCCHPSNFVPDFFHSWPLPQINVSPFLICSLAIFREQFSSAVHGKYARGMQCWRVNDNPRVTPRYRRRLSVNPWLCLLSVSPSQLNACDCTAHRQTEVSSQRCITLHMSPFLCWW